MSPESREELRQQTIAEYRIGDRARESVFNHVAELTAKTFGVPMALVTVLRRDRQIFSGACGLGGDETDRGTAFCNYTVEQPGLFIVADTLADPRFAEHPSVLGEPFIRFYAGAPLRIGGEVAVGSLCLIDRKPRTLDPGEQHTLQMLARTVQDLMELRVGSIRYEEQQAQLEHQRDLLRAMIDSVEQGMGLFDPELRLALWNERFFELLAFGPELRRRGMHGSELLRAAAERGYLGAGDPAAIVGELMNSALTNPRRQLEFRLPDGRVIGALRVTVPDGRSVLTLEDITERHEVGLMKDQFVSTVSHELRTPLTSIRGALALFKHGHGDRLDERGRRLIGMALSNSERLSTLIDDILDIEKLSARAVEHRVEETDLRDLTAEAVERNRPLGFASDVELDFHPGSEPLPLFGDPVRLQQAVTNLLSNAVKHSPKDGTVEVTTERNGEFARLRVADQGAGIPVEFRPKLFQRFSQAPSTRQRGTGGTGLGLAITRTIVERHGGTIAFECPADGGTLFWFDIPIAEPRS